MSKRTPFEVRAARRRRPWLRESKSSEVVRADSMRKSPLAAADSLDSPGHSIRCPAEVSLAAVAFDLRATDRSRRNAKARPRLAVAFRDKSCAHRRQGAY